MKLFTVVFAAAIVAVALAQSSGGNSSTTEPSPTSSTTEAPTSSTTQAPTTSSTPAPTTSTTAAPPTTSSTTPAPSTTSTTTTPRPKPTEATLSNYTLLNGDQHVCALVLMKVVVTQSATSYPLVNGTLKKELSSCNASQVTLWISAADGYQLQVVIDRDQTNFYIGKLAVHVDELHAERENLTQFSTPLKQYYKCGSASQVDLIEQDVKIIFSDMKYQAFQLSESADFGGTQLECVSDYHSDVVIIAIGCALALLVVVILVAYLIARRKNRQRGYQSV